jgi:hypothetical protein
MNKTTKFLLITMCAGVILAGCQKPVQPVEKASDSIAIEENSSINSDDNGNLDVDAKAIGEASKATNEAMDAANKAMAESTGIAVESKVRATNNSQADLEKEAADNSAAMDAANKAMAEANAKMTKTEK